MKKLYSFLVLWIFLSTQLFSQNYWIELKYPMTGILGKEVKKINKGDIIWEPKSDSRSISHITYESADEINDYKNKFRSVFLSFINSNKTKIRSISIRKLVIKQVDPESMDKLTIGRRYVYEGISADTVLVELSTVRELNLDIDELAGAVTTAMNKHSTEEVKRIIPLLDSSSYVRKDSIHYKMLIVNPNVYHKVRIISLFKLDASYELSYDERYQSFPYKGDHEKSSNILKVDATGIFSETDAIFPYYYSPIKREGKIPIKNVKFKLALRKIDNELKLFALVQPADLDGSWVELMEIPYVVEDNKRIWRLDRKRVYSFSYRGSHKSVYLKVTARQIDNSSVEIINWHGRDGRIDNAYTYIQYPDVHFIFVNK